MHGLIDDRTSFPSGGREQPHTLVVANGVHTDPCLGCHFLHPICETIPISHSPHSRSNRSEYLRALRRGGPAELVDRAG